MNCPPREGTASSIGMKALAVILAALFALVAMPFRASAGDERFFRERVAPLLAERCIRCHQGAKAKGGLNLTRYEGALKGGESGPAMVPGKPDQSLLVEYVSGDKPQMPKGEDALSKSQVAALRQWIAEG